MTDEKIYEELNEIFHDVFDDESIEVGPETTAADVEGWDSLANINIIVSIEDVFGMKFDMKEIGKFKCVGDIVEAIKSSIQ